MESSTLSNHMDEWVMMLADEMAQTPKHLHLCVPTLSFPWPLSLSALGPSLQRPSLPTLIYSHAKF